MSSRTATKQPDLVYDVGMHRGEDTELYLRKGFSVIAFEANPDLIANCKERFTGEIASGQLTIVEGAIIDGASAKTVTFYVNDVATIWGTVNESWADRNERMGWSSKKIEVPVVDFAACLEQYGMPHYLKIDIEGADHVCLDKLREFDVHPDYLSIESDKLSINAIEDELQLLGELGYNRFKAVQQGTVAQQKIPNPPLEGTQVVTKIQPDSSGLFGRETPGKWQDRAAIVSRYRRIMLGYRWFGNDSFMRSNRYARQIWRLMQRISGRPIPGWYDTHAKHSSATAP